MSDFTWSYSALKQYENCPRQYNEIRVLKNYVVKENEAMRYGTEVHKALEDYVAEGKPLAKNPVTLVLSIGGYEVLQIY